MTIRRTMVIYFIHTVVFLLFLISLSALASHDARDFFHEGRVLETCHLILLSLAGIVAVFGCLRRPAWCNVFVLIALFALLGIVRELDDPLKNNVPLIGWRTPATAVLITILVMLWTRRRQLAGELRQFLPSDAFGLLWSGFLVAAVIAQLLGHGELLEPILGDDYRPIYKRVTEEAIEASGYLLICLGSLQTLLRAPVAKRTPGPNG